MNYTLSLQVVTFTFRAFLQTLSSRAIYDLGSYTRSHTRSQSCKATAGWSGGLGAGRCLAHRPGNKLFQLRPSGRRYRKTVRLLRSPLCPFTTVPICILMSAYIYIWTPVISCCIYLSIYTLQLILDFIFSTVVFYLFFILFIRCFLSFSFTALLKEPETQEFHCQRLLP